MNFDSRKSHLIQWYEKVDSHLYDIFSINLHSNLRIILLLFYTRITQLEQVFHGLKILSTSF